jgi:hypothetical protein
MAAPADRTNEQAYWTAINSHDFQNRCVLQWMIAAVAVTTEAGTVTSHIARLALAGQILNGNFPPQTLAAWVLTNTTVQGEIVTDAGGGAAIGTSVPDSDIAFTVNSLFTGLATSLPSTALSTI